MPSTYIAAKVNGLRKKIYGWISQKYMNGCSNYNSLAVRRSCRSKSQARNKFNEHDIPHARGAIFLSPWSAHKFAREHGFPLCIKPNVSGFSRGSHFPINNYKELWKAALWAKVWWPTSVVEQYLLGRNYRVLATRDNLASVIRRYPPFVDGNGVDDIGSLIDTENATRKEMLLYPTIYPIQKNQQVISYLSRHGKSLSTIPTDGERVYLFNRVALAPGGVVETIERASVPRENEELFNKIVEVFDATVLGIDVIFEKGIEVPYTEQRCIFLEVNSRPYMKMHDVPRYGAKEDLSGFYSSMEKLVVADSDIF